MHFKSRQMHVIPIFNMLMAGVMTLLVVYFANDLSLLSTLRDVRALYPAATQFRIDYLDDGWISVEVILPEEVEVRRIVREIEIRQACRELVGDTAFFASENKSE